MGRLAKLRSQTVRSLPAPLEALVGGLGWGLAMAGSAAIALQWRIAGLSGHWPMLMGLFVMGGAMAWPMALFSMRLIAAGRSLEVRVAAAFLTLSAGTVGITSALFAVLYRNFYAQWHGEPFTALWLLQLAFTSVTAIYQFAVIGLGLYFPFGLAALIAASWWQANAMR
jgi:hypothetical protein